jgi:hypothetical protein
MVRVLHNLAHFDPEAEQWLFVGPTPMCCSRPWHVNCAQLATRLGSGAGTHAQLLQKRVWAPFGTATSSGLPCGDYEHSWAHASHRGSVAR